jgi:hypothetical protein
MPALEERHSQPPNRSLPTRRFMSGRHRALEGSATVLPALPLFTHRLRLGQFQRPRSGSIDRPVRVQTDVSDDTDADLGRAVGEASLLKSISRVAVSQEMTS